ncbi:histone deacetylase family protein [Uliginosibacterium gangwonense]|uniref:histone deacetylase family protein n=1 Tax=Uliginosibacterium gangwonense TaxID=392736 RepID=UPI00035C4BB1|nr:histone deacetylase family protein [Uliginosibacterium gangwonense]
MSTTALVSHRDCWLHSMGAMHPEAPERLSVIHDALVGLGLDALLDTYDAPLAEPAQLYRAHSPAYVDDLFEIAPEQGFLRLDPDTAMGVHTLRAALRAAGAGILATELVLDERVTNAFCAVRPPGHHAERLRAMGFCFFNNIAVAARHALDARGLERVAIIDIDVHHGNGTENIFAADPRVLMLSFFQHPLYPYCGFRPVASHLHNTPVPTGTKGERIRALVEEQWIPLLAEHRPQMLFISAGFDAHREDDMASLGLVDADYVWITERLRDYADAHFQGRIVSMLEGGYNLPVLSRCVVAHIRALAEL